MTLLIDPPDVSGHGRMWSHLASDASYDELHRFAASLGIPRRGFDRDHYDIPESHYENVVAAGAVPVTSRELIGRLHAAGLRRRKARTLAPRRAGRPLVRASRLHPGDTVAVVSPSGPAPDGPLDAGVAVLESWGLSVVLADNARGRHEHFDYLSGVDASRADDFMRAWLDPSVAAVFAARGGYGTQRMVDLLDWEALASAGAKPFVGFSDLTALHQAFAARLGMSTVHGPVVTSLGDGAEVTQQHLRRLLFEPAPGLSLTPAPAQTLVPGQADGVLVGGNLALLASEVGTPHSTTAADSVAVLEDAHQDAYEVDRLLTQLLRAGWFDDVRGIALGEFSDCGPEEVARAVVADRLEPLGVPMVWGVPVGHRAVNLAFPLGVAAHLDATAGMLSLTASALL